MFLFAYNFWHIINCININTKKISNLTLTYNDGDQWDNKMVESQHQPPPL